MLLQDSGSWLAQNPGKTQADYNAYTQSASDAYTNTMGMGGWGRQPRGGGLMGLPMNPGMMGAGLPPWAQGPGVGNGMVPPQQNPDRMKLMQQLIAQQQAGGGAQPLGTQQYAGPWGAKDPSQLPPEEQQRFAHADAEGKRWAAWENELATNPALQQRYDPYAGTPYAGTGGPGQPAPGFGGVQMLPPMEIADQGPAPWL